MKRADYVFAIGFDGNKAIVDKRSLSRYGKLDTRVLADKGLYRAACRSAIYNESEEEAAYVLEKYNAVSPVKYAHSSDLQKVFGIQPPSDDITGTRTI